MFDPAKKEEIASNIEDISTRTENINTYLTEANRVLTAIGLSSRSESIQDAVEKVRKIDNLKQAFDELESQTQTVVGNLKGYLCNYITEGVLSNLSSEVTLKIKECAKEVENMESIIMCRKDFGTRWDMSIKVERKRHDLRIFVRTQRKAFSPRRQHITQ